MSRFKNNVLLPGRFFAGVVLCLVGSVHSGSAQAIYNSIPAPLPGNVESVGLESAQAKELGDGLVFTMGSSRQLTTVSVVVSSYACTSGRWNNPLGGPNPCVTSPQNATFSQAVTLKIYAVNPGPPPEPGLLLATKTTTFNIPYRPSSDAFHCGSDGTVPGDDDEWYDVSFNTCNHGLATVITFDLSSQSITLPDQAIVTVTYNTTHSGYTPIGENAACFSSTAGCPYDFLNVSADGDPFLGSNVDVNGIYVNWSDPFNSCSGTTSGSLLLDTSCWTDGHPEILVNTTGNIAGAPPSIRKSFGNPTVPLHGSMSLDFVLTNPASNSIALTGVGFTDTLPLELRVASPSNVSNTCGGTATATPGTRMITLTGVTLAALGSCDISVDIVGFSAGPATNMVQVTSTNGGNGNIAMATVTVLAPPKIVKSFGTSTLNVGDTTTLTFSLSNLPPAMPSRPTHAAVMRENKPAGPALATSLTEIEFIDMLTAGLQVANPNSLNNTCGGQVKAAPGANMITLSATAGGTPVTLPPGGLCTVSVNVTATTPGLKLDYVWATSVNGGDSDPTSASVTVNGTPPSARAISVTPNGGTGLSQTFFVLYTDSGGEADLQAVYFEVSNTGAGATNSCFALYVQSTNKLYLFNDSNSIALGPIDPGSPSTVSNSQCTLSGTGGPVAASGTNLTVPFNLTFKPGFSGPKNLMSNAVTYGGSTGGWQSLGTWTPAPVFLSSLSLTPNGSTGLGPMTFNAVFSDNSFLGAQLLQVMYVDFGPTLFATNSCIVAYVTSNNTLYLFNDANSAAMGPVFAGNPASTVSNGQCTLNGAGGTGTLTGNNFTAPFNISFAPGFAGTKNAWGLAQDYYGQQGGWQVLGTWNP